MICCIFSCKEQNPYSNDLVVSAYACYSRAVGNVLNFPDAEYIQHIYILYLYKFKYKPVTVEIYAIHVCAYVQIVLIETCVANCVEIVTQ